MQYTSSRTLAFLLRSHCTAAANEGTRQRVMLYAYTLGEFFFSFFLLAATSRCKRTSSVINLPHLQQVVAYKLQQNLNFKFYDHNWFIHLFFVNLFVHFTLLLIIFHFCKLAAYKQKYEKKMISSRSLPLIEYNKISSSF